MKPRRITLAGAVAVLLADLLLPQILSHAQPNFNVSRDNVSRAPGTKEAVRQSRNPGVALLQTPNPKVAYAPPPLRLSPSQRAMLPQATVAAIDRQAANLQGATRYNVAPMELSASQQAMVQPAAAGPAAPAQPAAAGPQAQQAAEQETSAEQAADDGAVYIGDGKFNPPQYFPQGPVQKPVPIDAIKVPPPVISSTAGVVSDISGSKQGRIYSDCPELDLGSELSILHDWCMGAFWGNMIGRGTGKLDAARIESLVNALAGSSFAFQYGFMQGLYSSECDPELIEMIYQKMLEKAEEQFLEKPKKKKKPMNMFAPCVPSTGGGGGEPC